MTLYENMLSTGNTSAYIGAGRAYIVPAGAGARSVVGTVFGHQTTEANFIKLENTDGTEEWYTLDGRKLSQKASRHGLYINKGKKVIIK